MTVYFVIVKSPALLCTGNNFKSDSFIGKKDHMQLIIWYELNK